MALDTETVIDRRRLKRRLTAWRIAAVALALVLLGALLMSDKEAAGPAGLLPHIARVTVSGVITDDRRITEALVQSASAFAP